MKNIIIGLIIGASILGGCSVKESSSTTTSSSTVKSNIYTFNISQAQSTEGAQSTGNIIIGAFLIDKETEVTYDIGRTDDYSLENLLNGISVDVDMTELKNEHNLEDGDYGVFVYAWFNTGSPSYRYTEMSFDFSATQNDPEEIELDWMPSCSQLVTVPIETTSLVGKVDDMGIWGTVTQQIVDIIGHGDYKNDVIYEGSFEENRYYFGFLCPSDTNFPSWATYQPTITYYASNQDGIEYDGTNLSNYEKLGSYTFPSNLRYNSEDLDAIEALDFSSYKFKNSSSDTTNQ